MKCRSVACVWPGLPPLHRVTAIATVARPPTLYTGSINGSIIVWNLCGEETNQDIKPMAMMCSHTAPITDMITCCPLVDCASTDYVSLLSACTDGCLCTWSIDSGHSTRKCKLPPPVGSPIKLRTLPSNQRYVCIACCLLYSNVSELDPLRGEGSLQGESSKCSLIIVDSLTLSVTRTIQHDGLLIGSLKLMEVFSVGDRDMEYAVVVNSSRQMQLVLVSEGDFVGGKKESTSHNSPSMNIWYDNIAEWGSVVFFAKCDEFFAIIYVSVCVFGSIYDGKKVGEIYFSDNNFYFEGHCDQSSVTAAMFLENGISAFNAEHKRMFAVWNNRGYMVVYSLSFLDDGFSSEPLYVIPGLSRCDNASLSVHFIKLNSFLLRVASAFLDAHEPSFCMPNITIWPLSNQDDHHGKLWPVYERVGQGYYSIDGCKPPYTGNYGLTTNQEPHKEPICIDCIGDRFSLLKSGTDIMEKESCSDSLPSAWVVSSSIIISNGSPFPHALVYGFYNGEIELIQFHVVSLEFCSCEGSPSCKYYFSGHTGPILCLAAHQMVGSYKRPGSHNVLISGSKDCTVRIWDLDTNSLIIVLHQHVAPVRQVVLSPSETDYPWCDCFLSVADDSCVTLVSLETLRAERMFVGHSKYPSSIVWDGTRGYLACLCQSHVRLPCSDDVLYIWDIKSGARERVICGIDSVSMFDHFCASADVNIHVQKKLTSPFISSSMPNKTAQRASQAHSSQRVIGGNALKLSCPIPGLTTLSFDLGLLMSTIQQCDFMGSKCSEQNGISETAQCCDNAANKSPIMQNPSGYANASTFHDTKWNEWLTSIEGTMLRFCLSFLHLWDIDTELDKLLVDVLKVGKPGRLVASGLEGDGGALTLGFPGFSSCLEFWKSSSEFCAIRSLTMVSLAQQMITLSHMSSAAGSAVAAFYTRNFLDKFPDFRAPSLQILVSFWQDKSEHVRIAAHTLFYSAASRDIPRPLCCQDTLIPAECLNALDNGKEGCHGERREGTENSLDKNKTMKLNDVSELEQSQIFAWMDSYEMQDWISCIGGTRQDAKASNIIVAAALAIWYPNIVKPGVHQVIVHPLMKLVMTTNDMYSPTAAELLAEGMENTWKKVIGSEIPHLIGDIFFQVECVNALDIMATQNYAISHTIQGTLTGILLPSLATADIPGFLDVIESQIWSTASDSPVHLVSLTTLASVIHSSPKKLIPYLDKVVGFILQTMDPNNSVMRRSCFQSAATTLKQVVHTFPMVAFNDKLTRLAVGDAVGKIKNTTIRIYDLQSVKEVKVLDASSLPGLPNLFQGDGNIATTKLISVLSFSPDGEGLVAFSEHGLVIRWWSLASFWWERLGQNTVPVQCTKLIFVLPWDGLPLISCRSSVIANITRQDRAVNLQETAGDRNDDDNLEVLLHNLDLSYLLEWLSDRRVVLKKGALELGNFLL